MSSDLVLNYTIGLSLTFHIYIYDDDEAKNAWNLFDRPDILHSSRKRETERELGGERQRQRETDRQRQRQTDRQRQTNRQTDKDRDRQTDRQTDRTQNVLL